MRQGLAVLVLALLVALALWGMRAGWVHRRARTDSLVPEQTLVPQDAGAVRFGPVEAVYVSTTRAGDWLDRVNAQGLGSRSPAQVEVLDAGVRITRTGAPDLFVPRTALRAAAQPVQASRNGNGGAPSHLSAGQDHMRAVKVRGEVQGVPERRNFGGAA